MAARKKQPAKRKAPAKKKAAAKAKPVAKKAPAKRKAPAKAKAKAVPKKAAKRKAPASKKAAATKETTKRPDMLGNEIWKLRSWDGPRPKFDSAQSLWEACCGYFEWVEKNPLTTQKAFQYEGKPVFADVEKMRPMTLAGLYNHLHINKKSWQNWRTEDRLKDVVEFVENIIWEQKFSGAAVEAFNWNIIARELGLKEKSEQEVSGPGGGPMEMVTHIGLVPLEPLEADDSRTGSDST